MAPPAGIPAAVLRGILSATAVALSSYNDVPVERDDVTAARAWAEQKAKGRNLDP